MKICGVHKIIKLIAAIFFGFIFWGGKVPSDKTINISVQVKGIPANRLYISEAHNWQTILDSADYKDGFFLFKYKIDSSFEPFTACITFKDKEGKIKTLFYKNPFLSTPQKKYSNNGFGLEKQNIEIKGDYPSNDIYIKAGKETEVLFKTQLKEFAYINTKDSVERRSIIDDCIKLINQYPSSYYLLYSIFNNKDQYSKPELERYLSLFNTNVQNSNSAKKLKTYLKLRPDKDKPLANLYLTNSRKEVKRIIDTTARMNMLIFWASWCGPCLQEIPYLKTMYERFAGKGLNMSSISIDKDTTMWVNALDQQKMQWNQFILNAAQREETEALFNYSAIPVLILTDTKGNEILRSVGFDENHLKGYINYISEKLK